MGAKEKPDNKKNVPKTHTFKQPLYKAFNDHCKAKKLKISRVLNDLISAYMKGETGEDVAPGEDEAGLKSDLQSKNKDADRTRRLLQDHKVYDDMMGYLEGLGLDVKRFSNYQEVIAKLLQGKSEFTDNDVALTISLIEINKELCDTREKLDAFRTRKYRGGENVGE